MGWATHIARARTAVRAKSKFFGSITELSPSNGIMALSLKSLLVAAGCAVLVSLAKPAEPTGTNHLTNASTNSAPNAQKPLKLQPRKDQILPLSTNTFGKTPNPSIRKAPNPVTSTNAAWGFPAPGVYKTEPFACIVIVPDGHLDEQMLIPAAGPVSNMPVLKPELRFVPLKPRSGAPNMLPNVP